MKTEEKQFEALKSKLSNINYFLHKFSKILQSNKLDTIFLVSKRPKSQQSY